MRIENLKAKMARENLESFLITDMKNIYYLTGFSGTAGTIFLTKNRNIFMTDSRYSAMAKEIISGFEIIETRDALAQLPEIIAHENLKTVAFEETVDYAFFKQLSTIVRNIEIFSTSNFLMEFRQIKDEDEIRNIRKACEITDKAFLDVLKFIEPGREEIEIANFLDFKMREFGASGTSFDTIVASGKRSSLPHGVASHKVIEFGDTITMDFGCFYEHYASDMTRTIFVGEANPKIAEIYHVVREANQKLIDKAQAGLTYADFDKIPRDVIEQAGFGKYFTHGIGHGVGLDIHEIPYFGQKMTEKLQTNMLVTDEPGIYLPDLGGVRIEDDLLITENGCEVLTQAPKELIVI
ncbi:M24 family metallopeptidase [Lactococcus nasutitermitis]|uniref:M24 family metallopeptidase n=1 Tax=Lactococcus nasutitermitis TaxID=1652957 RepID=A0ABV9J9Z1_9LACT|nr:aminopeptidase P family protein [Lactococcus nasutitermitis]